MKPMIVGSTGSVTRNQLSVRLVALSLATAIGAQCQPRWQSLEAVDVPGGGRANVLWDPDGAGPLPQVLVTSGEFTDAGGQLAANIAAYDFASGRWSPLGAGVNGARSSARC